MINLTNEQLQTLFNKKAEKENGLNQVLTITLNAIMHSERTAYLKTNQDSKNKGNGYRPVKVNGYGRQLALAVPRDRLGTFKPLLMLTLREEEQEVKNLCFELYREGLTTRKISALLEKLYGKQYSKTTVSLMSQSFKQAMDEWRNRPLDKQYLVVYLDALQAKVRRETVQGEAFYIALAVKEDYTREIIFIENQPTESASGWRQVLHNLKKRGVENINLVVADGLPGLEKEVLSIFPKASFQQCVTHFKRNILYKVRSTDKPFIADDLANVFEIQDKTYTPSEAATRAKTMMNKWAAKYLLDLSTLSNKERTP